MAVLSPLQYRLALLKERVFGDKEIVPEVLICHRNKLPTSSVEVSWKRDGEYIVGAIKIEDEKYPTQARSAKEFVEMVNDVIYAVYEIPHKYIEPLGGAYRITPSQEEFAKLNDAAVKKSSFSVAGVKATA